MDAPLNIAVEPEFKKASISVVHSSCDLLNKLELAQKVFKRSALLLVFGILLSILWVGVTNATSTDKVFLVPLVSLTPSGAVIQPQNGSVYSPAQNTNTIVDKPQVLEAGQISNFETSGAYNPPKYDAFSERSMTQSINLPTSIIKNVEDVDFSVYNNQPGSLDRYAGTTQTTFTFRATTASINFHSSEMEYRWDFENDGELDSYFSRLGSITHNFTQPGEYLVKLEALDPTGQVHSVVKKVIVVQNSAPRAIFTVNNVFAPENSIFRFDTSLSHDDQYTSNQLKYRFDWNGDSKFDTNYQSKTVWNHLFREVGTYDVIMEAIDPEGASNQTHLTLEIVKDSAPTANFSVEKLSDLRYQFDATATTDDYSKGRTLKYRWDFNYAGKDDIIFDTNWSNSPKLVGSYKLGGTKMIRLQVKDEQGFIDEAFAKINVSWPEEYLNRAVSIVH